LPLNLLQSKANGRLKVEDNAIVRETQERVQHVAGRTLLREIEYLVCRGWDKVAPSCPR
jgi:hypothetical protein